MPYHLHTSVPEKLLEISKLAKENNIGPVKSIEIYQCVMLTKLKTDDCTRMHLSSIGAASTCIDRCGGLRYAYALIHYPTCRCVPSELYKLVDIASSMICSFTFCTDGTDCGGTKSNSNQCDNDCRCMNQKSLVYSSFIANSSGMTHSCFLACWVHYFIRYDGF